MDSNLKAADGRRPTADFFWRLSVFLLPWQIRWFSEGPWISGYPWEAGRLSMYLSWMPMIATILLAARPSKPKNAETQRAFPSFLGIGFLLIACASAFTLAPRATFQAAAEIAVLTLFVLALIRLRVPSDDLLRWFAWSLIPHAILGVWQFATQFVEGNKWLGMAAHDPAVRGTSVVEYAGVRLLRAYGGFPHPNIFGGWLAVAMPVTAWLAHEDRRRAWMWIACGAGFSAALVLTFSRSAWLAAIIGLAFFAFARLRQMKSIGALALGAVVASAALTAIWQYAPIVSRFQPTARLEAKSLDERTASWRDGAELFLRYPLVGVGPGAALFALQTQNPPHNVPLLMLDELGLVGLLGLLFLFLETFSSSRFRFQVRGYGLQFTTILILGLFDHYPWSYWSGRALVVIVILSLILPKSAEA